MGRYLKNSDLRTGSYAIQIPVGSSSVGPDVPQNGQMRFNQTNTRLEMFYNSAWNQVAKIGTVGIVVDEFVGDGLTLVNFTMSQSELSDSAVVVFIGGVYQQPTTNYTVSGTTITFTSPPPAPGINPNKIVVVHNLNSTDAA